MRAPKKKAHSTHWHLPDKEWLDNQYRVQDKSALWIADETGVDASTILAWLDNLGIRRKTSSEVKLGDRNPNWKGGEFAGRAHHRAKARRLMRDAGIPQVCSWCGQKPEPSLGRKGQIQVHHIDHDPGHHSLANQQYLCYHCHQFETALWHLLKQGKIDLVCEGRQMIITFRR